MRKTGRTAINKKDAIICALLIALTVAFIWNFRFVRVVGESMEPTLADGQWLFTTTHTSELNRNDIVVFRYEIIGFVTGQEPSLLKTIVF